MKPNDDNSEDRSDPKSETSDGRPIEHSGYDPIHRRYERMKDQSEEEEDSQQEDK